MAVAPLSQPELAAVAALVSAGRLDKVPADTRRATAFMSKAQDRLEQLPLLTSIGVRYDLAYDADQLRRSRNQSHYEAAPIGAAASDQAEAVARDLYAAAVARGVTS